MSRVLSLVIIAAGVWTAFTGVWGLADAGSNSTAELQEMQRWICGALISGGFGLIAAGVARLVPAIEDRTTV